MEDVIIDGYEFVMKVEVIEVECLESLLLDLELLVFFEEVLEMFCVDDWCIVWFGEGEVVVIFGSILDFDSLFWLWDVFDFFDYIFIKVKLNKFEILEDYVEKFYFCLELFKKVLLLKVVLMDIEE